MLSEWYFDILISGKDTLNNLFDKTVPRKIRENNWILSLCLDEPQMFFFCLYAK